MVIGVLVDGLVVVEEYLAIQSCVNVKLFAHLSLIVSFQVVLSDFLHWSEYVAFIMLQALQLHALLVVAVPLQDIIMDVLAGDTKPMDIF